MIRWRKHSEYLKKLYLDNDLATGRFLVEDRPIALQNMREPIFIVGTEGDHVALWRSVYKLHYLVDTDLTFVLTSGGHNAGIVSEPGHARRRYRVSTKHHDDRYVDPDRWLATAQMKEGSWWPEWIAWLDARSGALVASPPMGAARAGYAPLADAPGTYVLQG
jgi:polyhydroxyalkanoate synthase